MLQGALVAAATSVGAHRALALPARAFAVPADALLVYDSRLLQSRALERGHVGRSIDLAHEHANRWSTLRSLRSRQRVVGFTSWTDLVQTRPLLAGELATACRGARGRLFYWELA
jgi:hypothetical protein